MPPTRIPAPPPHPAPAGGPVMSVNSDAPRILSGVFEEYQRYERYLAVAYGIVFVSVVSLLCPDALWGGCLGLIAAVSAAFRRYHVVVHRFIGSPTEQLDRQVQLWGTTAQAIVWAALPLTVAICMVQIAT